MQMNIDGNAEPRQPLAKEEEFDVSPRRERFHHAAGIGVDVSQPAGEPHARGLTDMVAQRVEGGLEKGAVMLPQSSAIRLVAGQSSFDG
jgi:hypothetical protein